LVTPPEEIETATLGETLISTIYSIKNGYGFIKYAPNNLFFHYTSLIDTDFNELQQGDAVSFTLASNDRGEFVAKNVKLADTTTYPEV
jgi:cold shock CspA family protein